MVFNFKQLSIIYSIVQVSVSQFNAAFAGYGSCTCSEFLLFIVDALHEDHNRILCKPYTNLKPHDVNDQDEKCAQLDWNIFKMRNDSIVVDLMSSLIKTEAECSNCQMKSKNFDPLFILSVNCPKVSNDELSIEEKGLMRIRWMVPFL